MTEAVRGAARAWRPRVWPLLAVCALIFAPLRAEADCLLVADAADGRVLLETGTCDERVTPASTFKLALAAIAFDAGVLKGAHDPMMTYREGEIAWGGDKWRGDIDPEAWLERSVVWHSQRLVRALTPERVSRTLRALGYGNADLSGDPDAGRGPEWSWIASSLKISASEQMAFLRELDAGTLDLDPAAMSQALALLPAYDGGEGWRVKAKTGGAFRLRPDGGVDRSRGWGWFVGRAEKGAERLLFVRQVIETNGARGSPGRRVRDDVLARWPVIAREALAAR